MSDPYDNDRTPPMKPMMNMRGLNAESFLRLGGHHMGYVRPAVYNGQHGYSLHGADGTALAFHVTAAAVFAIARQNDCDATLIH